MATRDSTQNAKSRYTQGGETTKYRRRLGWWERDLENFQHADDDVFVTLSNKYDRRPDVFAADYFGSSVLMWLVLQYNHIVDINEEFIAGKRIRIPNTSRALFSMLNKRTGGVPPSNT